MVEVSLTLNGSFSTPIHMGVLVFKIWGLGVVGYMAKGVSLVFWYCE